MAVMLPAPRQPHGAHSSHVGLAGLGQHLCLSPHRAPRVLPHLHRCPCPLGLPRSGSAAAGAALAPQHRPRCPAEPSTGRGADTLTRAKLVGGNQTSSSAFWHPVAAHLPRSPQRNTKAWAGIKSCQKLTVLSVQLFILASFPGVTQPLKKVEGVGGKRLGLHSCDRNAHETRRMLCYLKEIVC